MKPGNPRMERGRGTGGRKKGRGGRVGGARATRTGGRKKGRGGRVGGARAKPGNQLVPNKTG